MIRRLLTVSLVLLLLGSQVVFAQGMDLPEPEFSGYAAAPESSRSVFSVPELRDAVSYLWGYGSSQKGYVEYTPYMTLAQAASTDAVVPRSIRNNRYFLESVRLTNLANLTYEEGDYDASTRYSEEAVRYAYLSDEFVRLQLKIKETDDAIASARRRIDYATSVNAATRYPTEYSRAQSAYVEARSFRAAENWDEAISAANRVLALLAAVTDASQPVAAQPPAQPAGQTPLPAQYTVRPWAASKDCLWNIAGRSWAYNDPKQWKVIYEANKARMPQPNNPDLIHPGFILNIPSIKGEYRQGMWDANAAYPSLR